MDDFFERFADRIMPEPNSGCMLWTGSATPKGYGTINRFGRSWLAHRAAYEAEHGAGAASGIVVRHSCDCPLCVNPAHLIAGSHADNNADMRQRGRERHSPIMSREEAGAIVARSRKGETGPQLAAAFGRSLNAVHGIINGQSRRKRWKSGNSNPARS